MTIGFAENLVPLVKSGSKTLTYRLGDKYAFLKSGDEIATKDSGTGEVFGKLKIKSIEKVSFVDLPIDRDGHEKYSSKEEQREVFERYYGKFNDTDTVTILEFTFVPQNNWESRPQIIKDVGFDFSWDSKKVWALDEPVIDMDTNELIWHFDIPFWEVTDTDDYNLPAWKVIKEPENEAHSEHWKKIQEADLRYPIDIMENKGRWLILDGLHRLVKLYVEGAKTVKVRKIPRSRISEISK